MIWHFFVLFPYINLYCKWILFSCSAKQYIYRSHLRVLPSLLCVFPPCVCDLCALALGNSTLTLPTFPAALAVQKLHLIKTFNLFPILLCWGCRHGSLAISLIDNSVFFVR